MTDIRYPNITGGTEAAQLLQVRSYLHQLVDQLNVTLAEVEGRAVESANAIVRKASSTEAAETNAKSTFNSIKALIIKSADIINAYYDEINYRLEGVYVAESDFGDYAERTTKTVEETAALTQELYTNVQAIVSEMEGIKSQVIEANAYINSGLLDYDEDGVPIYGLEIGQRNEIDGEEVFNQFARFTAARLSFYDQNDNEVAYVSDKKLYITHVEVTGTFALGGFKDEVQADGSIVTKWVGGV